MPRAKVQKWEAERCKVDLLTSGPVGQEGRERRAKVQIGAELLCKSGRQKNGPEPEPEPGAEYLNLGPDGRDPRPENVSRHPRMTPVT